MPYKSSITLSFVSSPPSSTSLSLLQRVKEQDSDAWDRLVDLYGPLIFLWCRRAGLNREDAKDVVQEVWIALKPRICSFRRDRPKDSFRGWLYGITRNKIGDHWRNREPRGKGGSSAAEVLGNVPAPQSDSDELVASDKQILMRQALEIIRPEFENRIWRAFWRVAVDECPAKEVAAELGMTVGAVYQAKYRVLHRLRDEMSGLLD
jgi:RNA polymerase sigma-70 factor, ECF subfamily